MNYSIFSCLVKIFAIGRPDGSDEDLGRSGFYQLLNRLQILSPTWPVLTLWRKNIRSFQAVCSRIFRINTETSKFPSSQLIWRCCCFWFSCHPIFIISSMFWVVLPTKFLSILLSPVTPLEVRTLTGNFQKLLAQVLFLSFLCITQVLQTINL